MKFTPSSVLRWYKGLPSWLKVIAWILLMVLIVAATAWFLLNKISSVGSITHDSETTRDAVSYIEKEHVKEKEQIVKRAEKLENKKKKEQNKRKELKKERKNEFKEVEKEHNAIDGAGDIDDVVNLFNKNRSKRKT